LGADKAVVSGRRELHPRAAKVVAGVYPHSRRNGQIAFHRLVRDRNRVREKMDGLKFGRQAGKKPENHSADEDF
jgi:hypothetical protein